MAAPYHVSLPADLVEQLQPIAASLGIPIEDYTLQVLQLAIQPRIESGSSHPEMTTALKLSENRFHLLFHGTPMIAMQVYDENRRVIDWNQASEQLYGYTREEALGQRLEDLIIPAAIKSWVVEIVTQWQQGGDPIPPAELTLQNKFGEPVQVYSSHFMIWNVAGKPEMFCLDIDLRERQQIEADLRASELALQAKATKLEATLAELEAAQLKLIQSERMSALGSLVAGIAHEINNPVNFIAGNLRHANQYVEDLLNLQQHHQEQSKKFRSSDDCLETEIDLEFIAADLPKVLNSMHNGTQRIQHIVTGLRDFSGLDEAEFKPVDIHVGLDSTLLMLEHRCKATNTQCQIDIDRQYADLPKVTCYASQLNQVFLHLINNAIDALESLRHSTRDRQPQLSIRTEPREEGVQVTICDNGIGIKPEQQSQILNPFFTSKPVGQGTGMGLAISHQIIVDRHQGRLEFESTPNQGTTFTLLIPFQSQPVKATDMGATTQP